VSSICGENWSQSLIPDAAQHVPADAMKGRQGPSASALARLPTPSAEDIEQALRAAAAEEAAAAHAAAAARHSLHQTTQVGQSTAGQGAPGVTSCGGEVSGLEASSGCHAVDAREDTALK
jgi:hypothetical protein